MSPSASLPKPVLDDRGAAQLGVERAVEPLGESRVLLVGQWLVVEDEQACSSMPRRISASVSGFVRAAQVDRAHLGREVLVQPLEAQGPSPPPDQEYTATLRLTSP
jgi:hypothetical protein